MKFPNHAFGTVLRITLIWSSGFGMGYGARAIREVETIESEYCPNGTIASYKGTHLVICRCLEGPKP